MNPKALYFRLGIFIVLAITALVALAVVLGTGSLFQKNITAESYFNESVQGLEVGSKVLFRGVMVGNITRLTFTYVKYEQERSPGERKPYVLVEFMIRPELVGGMNAKRVDLQKVIRDHVDRGLRVRHAPQGVTGLSYLEVDYTDPKTNPPLPIDWEPEHLYIPSTRSTVGRIVTATEELVRRLGSVDVEGFVTNVNMLALALTRQVEDLQVERLSRETLTLVGDLRQTNQRLQRILASPAWDDTPRDVAAAARDAAVAAARVRKMTESEDFHKALTQMQQTLTRIDRMVAGRENDVAVTLNNLRQITDNLRDLSENAKRYPSGVIFGEPPKRDPRPR
jgi:ABC-type transporter Mla subunit MlaD